jgi:hypothetical protein
MNAISYYSLNQISISKHHQFKAISALREAITQITDYKSRAQAIAASMLLSMYEVRLFNNTAHGYCYSKLNPMIDFNSTE